MQPTYSDPQPTDCIDFGGEIMPCAWARRVREEVLNKYPNALIVQARAYERPREIDTNFGRVTIPAIDRPTQWGAQPLYQCRKLLSKIYDPADPPHTIVIQYHPLGGIAWLRQ